MFYRSIKHVYNTKQLRMPRLSIGDDYSYLKWDGSYLGQFPASCKVSNIKDSPYNKYVLELVPRYPIIVRMHASKTSYACIVDELNPIFGKVKIGTHTLKIGYLLYTIYNLPYNELITVKKCQPVSLDFKISVQDAFVFRAIVGLTMQTESSLYVHPSGAVTSYRNKKPLIIGNCKAIFVLTTEKWFVDDYEESISRLVSNAGGIHKVRSKVQSVIYRIDKDLIWLDHVIYDNITKLI